VSLVVPPKGTWLPREDPELGHLRCFGIFAGQDRQRLVEVQDDIRVGLGNRLGLGKVKPFTFAAVFLGFLAARVIDQDAAHGLSRRLDKMSPPVPLRILRAAYQPQVGLMDQRRRLKRLSRLFLGQLLSRQPAPDAGTIVTPFKAMPLPSDRRILSLLHSAKGRKAHVPVQNLDLPEADLPQQV
jgi:hypothetical protein